MGRVSWPMTDGGGGACVFSHIPPKLCALGPTVLSPALPCPVPAVEARFGMGWPYLLPRLQSWAGARPGDEWTARVSQGPEEEKGLLDRRLCWRDIDSTHPASFFLPLGSRPGDGHEVKMPCTWCKPLFCARRASRGP